MTICIAAICEHGSSVVLAADRMITSNSLSIQFEHHTRKLAPLSDHCMALTAGDALAHTELFFDVQKEVARLKSPSVFEIVDKIKECYQNIRQREIRERVLKPKGINDFDEYFQLQRTLLPDLVYNVQNQIDNYEYGLGILVAGVGKNDAHIFGIGDPGTSVCLDAIGFHALGSGTPHAMTTLIGRNCNAASSLEEAVLFVYEAKTMAEKAPGVGSNITDIHIINGKGITEFPPDRYDELREAYEKWLRRESGWMDDVGSLLKAGGFKR